MSAKLWNTLHDGHMHGLVAMDTKLGSPHISSLKTLQWVPRRRHREPEPLMLPAATLLQRARRRAWGQALWTQLS